MKREITLCGEKFCYELERKRIRSLNLRINKDGSLRVTAPSSVLIREVEGFLIKNGERICRMREKLRQSELEAPMPADYSEGESFSYMGRILTLHICPGRGGGEIKDGALYLRCREPENPECRRRAFEAWMLGETERMLREICSRYFPSFCPPLTKEPEIKFRRMRSAWGNCRPERCCLTFNSRLSALPYECMEYVAAHEFTHFFHADHSKRFYARLEKFMPDWRERDRRLRKFGAVLR